MIAMEEFGDWTVYLVRPLPADVMGGVVTTHTTDRFRVVSHM